MNPNDIRLTGPRPAVEIKITIELPRVTLAPNAFTEMVGGHVTVKHQPTGQQVDAVCLAVTYHEHDHTITLRLQLPSHDLPHHGWQLAHPPTITWHEAPSPIGPPPTLNQLRHNNIDLTPYVRQPIDQHAYRIRPEL